MRQRSSAMRAARAVAIGLIALAIAATVVNEFTPHGGGTTSSSYATASDGLAGYAALLMKSGHPVTRLRTAPSTGRLDPASTIVMLDPGVVLQRDVAALRTFVRAGGRLVAGGQAPEAWLSELLAGAPNWTSRAPQGADTLVPVPGDGGRAVRQSDGTGTFTQAGATLPVLGTPGEALATVVNLGAGRIVLLADSSPLQNHLLARADDAALGLAIAGPAGRPVAFEEAVHGYGEARGLAALPTRWKWALGGLLLAAFAAVASRFRRLGPAQPTPAPPQPPRRAHVDALASALARTGRPAQAAEPVQARARSLVLARARLTHAATRDPAPCGRHAPRSRRGRGPGRRHTSTDQRRRAAGWSCPRQALRRHPMNDLIERLRAELRHVVVGQDEAIELLLSALVLGGHVLLQGVPGVAKSLLANAFARTVGGSYRRVQFTPDMLPSDLTGTMTLRGGELAFRPGPVFANVLLADEINRTPPKTQSALLEAMQERQVSVDGTPHPLPEPFLVVATQNPIEYEGTYPLPEAQLDRFLFQAEVGYPDEAQERAVLCTESARCRLTKSRCDQSDPRRRRARRRPVRRRRDDRHRRGDGLRRGADPRDALAPERLARRQSTGRRAPARGDEGAGPARRS